MATPSPACDSFATGHIFAASISHPQRNTACFKICKLKWHEGITSVAVSSGAAPSAPH